MASIFQTSREIVLVLRTTYYAWLPWNVGMRRRAQGRGAHGTTHRASVVWTLFYRVNTTPSVFFIKGSSFKRARGSLEMGGLVAVPKVFRWALLNSAGVCSTSPCFDDGIQGIYRDSRVGVCMKVISARSSYLKLALTSSPTTGLLLSNLN